MNNLATSAPSAPSARIFFWCPVQQGFHSTSTISGLNEASLSIPVTPRITRYTCWQVIWWVKTGQTWPTMIDVIHAADQNERQRGGLIIRHYWKAMNFVVKAREPMPHAKWSMNARRSSRNSALCGVVSLCISGSNDCWGTSLHNGEAIDKLNHPSPRAYKFSESQLHDVDQEKKASRTHNAKFIVTMPQWYWRAGTGKLGTYWTHTEELIRYQATLLISVGVWLGSEGVESKSPSTKR